MKKLIAAVLMFTATAAFAAGPMGNGNGNGNGGTTCTGTCTGTPQGQGNGPGNGPGNGHGNGQRGPGAAGANLVIGTDGTAYVVRNTTATDATTPTFSLTAFSATGATLWTVTISDPGPLFLSGTNLIKVSHARPESAGTRTSMISALSTTTGATLWSKEFEGAAHSVTPVNGGVYAVIATPAATAGAQPTRSLVAISSTGAVLFTVAI